MFAHRLRGFDCGRFQALPGRPDHVLDQHADHVAGRAAQNHPGEVEFQVGALLAGADLFGIGHGVRPQSRSRAEQVVQADQSGVDRVLDVMGQEGALIGLRNGLGLGARLWVGVKLGTPGRDVVKRLVAGDALAGGPGQVQPAKSRVGRLDVIHDLQGMLVGVPAAVIGHQLVQGCLAGVPEGPMTQVVAQGDRFTEALVEAQLEGDAAADLGDFQRVGDAGSKEVRLGDHEHLGLVQQAAKGARVQDPVAVTGKRRPPRRLLQLSVSAIRPGGFPGRRQIR